MIHCAKLHRFPNSTKLFQKMFLAIFGRFSVISYFFDLHNMPKPTGRAGGLGHIVERMLLFTVHSFVLFCTASRVGLAAWESDAAKEVVKEKGLLDTLNFFRISHVFE